MQTLSDDYIPETVTYLPLSSVAPDTRETLITERDNPTNIGDDDGNDSDGDGASTGSIIRLTHVSDETSDADEGTDASDEEDVSSEMETSGDTAVVTALSSLTLSGEASARWAQLPRVDLIRQRNKPTEPVSATAPTQQSTLCRLSNRNTRRSSCRRRRH